MIKDNIIAIAKSYLGKEEIQPNRGFKDKDFERKLRALGWEPGQPWCAYLGILVWTEVYVTLPKIYTYLKRLFSANSQGMGRNFHADAIWPTSTTTPKEGAMVIFGDVGSTISGHTACAVIAVDLHGKTYTTIEGNTRPAGNPGNQAEGYIVATHVHVIGAPHPVSGLEFIRFIYPIEPGQYPKYFK